MDTLRKDLEDLGATHVVTYDDLQDKKTIKAKLGEWTNGQVFTPPSQFRNRSLTRVRKGHPSRIKLCRGRIDNVYGQPLRQRRSPGDVRRNGKTPSHPPSVVPYIQKPYKPWVLAQ
jgi:hypothetical protein